MHELIESAKCVLFDFDGPVCHLFRLRPASDIAGRLRDEFPQAELPRSPDPQDYLPLVFRSPRLVDDGTARALEAALTREELATAPSALPTAYADRLIRTLHATGRTLAVATNNSQAAVECYLGTRGLRELFDGHIHGRTPEGVLRVKPDPWCLERALESTGASAGDAVMIGDAPRDLEAARAAGVRFIGYAPERPHKDKYGELREAGAEHIVRSLSEVLLAVDPDARV
ncbi:HAD family hydrolase [Streptomyces sp. NPDC048172]|uniref:HAD family hydrolase n=1 Tax=Streptomyces sp. NPDC048172 TaxID=3365505 RepID=UPI0037220E98